MLILYQIPKKSKFIFFYIIPRLSGLKKCFKPAKAGCKKFKSEILNLESKITHGLIV